MAKKPQGRIMCVSTFPATLARLYPPSTRRRCDNCGETVFVSEAMVGKVDSGELSPICEICLAVDLIGNDTEPLYKIHPDQREELERYGVLGFAEDFVRKLNEKQQHRTNQNDDRS